ncbi:hypothetical protein PIROE2DRAFT_12375, partial [Piromyces sp. E2]
YIFKSDDQYNINAILNGNALFLKYWYFPYGNKDYKKGILLGKNEGVSGSTIGGYNIGISKYIDEKNKKAAIKALKFFTSLEYQKNFTIAEKYFSGIRSLYDDEDVCNSVNCDLAKSFQPIARPNSPTDDYDSYSEKFRKYIFDFLYNDKSAEEVLNKIDDLTKIYTISFDSDETPIGFVIYDAEIVIVEDGKNFKTCKHSSSSGLVILIILIFLKFITLLFLALLIFMEWNMKATIKNVRLSMSSVSSHSVSQSTSTMNSNNTNSSFWDTIMKFHYYTGGRINPKINTNNKYPRPSLSVQSSGSMDTHSNHQISNDIRKSAIINAHNQPKNDSSTYLNNTHNPINQV